MLRRRRKREINKVQDTIKPYVQFSKKIIAFCILNLLVIEIFVMVMVYTTKDTGVLPYLITSLAVQFLGCVVWYLKNSEAEKKVRIEAEIQRMKLVSDNNISNIINKVKQQMSEAQCEPDTFYKGNEGNSESNNDIQPIIDNNSCSYDNDTYENDDGSVG